jgi:hypothetical protein
LKNRNADDTDAIYGSSRSNINRGIYNMNQDSGSKVSKFNPKLSNLFNEISSKSPERVVSSDKNNRHRVYNQFNNV